MNKLVGLVIVLAASRAVAAPVALDYAASDASCIDAARFSDEVSAKLGFVPWDAKASANIRIRVQKDGAQFTGTFRNVDGSAKIIDGKTCGDVTESLVLTVAMAVDSTVKPAAAPHAAPPPPPAVLADGMIPVTFRAVDGSRVSIGVQKGAGIGVASNGVAVAAAYFDTLCTSPCTAGLPHGRNYLTFADPDSSSFAGDNYLIDHPTTLTLEHKSRRGWRIGLLVGGAAATALGGLWLSSADCGNLEGSCGGPIAGGTTAISLGLTSMLLSLFVHDTFNISQSP